MEPHFFPGPVFAWVFLGVLLSLLAAAAYTDLGRMVVPKRVTLTALALGLAFNLLRGALLGAWGLATWTLPAGSAWLGACDGVLFALAGFALGFALFFAMWVLGVCGGGDVKLFAALGAWVGPLLAICVLGMTLLVVAAFVFARLALGLVGGRGLKNLGTAPPSPSSVPPAAGREGRVRGVASGRPPGAQAGKEKLHARGRILGFSLPLAIAAAVVLFWTFRVDLQFVPAPTLAARGLPHHAN
jgi:Flp pilus assembly protein protease CpaA